MRLIDANELFKRLEVQSNGSSSWQDRLLFEPFASIDDRLKMWNDLVHIARSVPRFDETDIEKLKEAFPEKIFKIRADGTSEDGTNEEIDELRSLH